MENYTPTPEPPDVPHDGTDDESEGIAFERVILVAGGFLLLVAAYVAGSMQ